MLVLDLTGVTFLAASGIKVLLEARVYTTRAVCRVLDAWAQPSVLGLRKTLRRFRPGMPNPSQVCVTAGGSTGCPRTVTAKTEPFSGGSTRIVNGVLGAGAFLVPLAIMVALLLGGMIFGIVGALVAIPVAAATLLIVQEVLLPRLDHA
jgi:hypothetical protein